MRVVVAAGGQRYQPLNSLQNKVCLLEELAWSAKPNRAFMLTMSRVRRKPDIIVNVIEDTVSYACH